MRFEALVETEAMVTRAPATDAMIPSYDGGKFPLSTHLARRVRAMLADPRAWRSLPLPVAEWLELQSQEGYLTDQYDEGIAALREAAALRSAAGDTLREANDLRRLG